MVSAFCCLLPSAFSFVPTRRLIFLSGIVPVLVTALLSMGTR